MVWNKVKKQLEEFITPSLIGIVEYRPSGYRYTKEKAANCYLTVNKVEVFNSKVTSSGITWYENEQEIKNDDEIHIKVSQEDVDKIKAKSGNKIPEDRLEVIAKGHKKSQVVKDIFIAQQQLSKIDFQKMANTYLTSSVEKCLESDDIILNVLAIIDRRVGKKRLVKMRDEMGLKHPVVKYFYDLRINTKAGIYEHIKE